MASAGIQKRLLKGGVRWYVYYRLGGRGSPQRHGGVFTSYRELGESKKAIDNAAQRARAKLPRAA